MLMKVQNDILLLKDQGKVLLLALLDLSATFDTVNHSILIDKLNHDYGISDIALAWFQPYLANCEQKIQIGESLSDPVCLNTGVLQGSGSGPGQYTRCTRELGSVMRDLLILFHFFFAEDSAQLYNGIDPNSITDQLESRKQLENGAELVGCWMNKNKLKLNKSKTEFIMIGTKTQLQKNR